MPEQFLHGVEVVEIDTGIRAIRTPKSSIIAFVGTAPDADAAVFPLNVPVLVGTPSKAAQLGTNGTLPDAWQAAYNQGTGLSVMIRVADEAAIADQLSTVVGNEATLTGVYAIATAPSILGVVPRIFAAPGFTSQRPNGNANPVGAALKGIAEKMRAVVIVDGPNTTEAEVLAARNDYGSDRVYIVDPAVLVFEGSATVAKPASAYVAGLISKRDHEKGFWWSPSNQIINGITGVARPIGFGLSAPDTEANRLNENEVATIVHREGYRLWGNRTTATDPNWAFLPVRRTADMIYEAIDEAFLFAMDRPISKQTVNTIKDSVDAYLRHLTAVGAILGGRSYLDPELNTEATLKAGKLYIDFDIEPPAPLEHLTFRAFRNGAYYEELVADLAA